MPIHRNAQGAHIHPYYKLHPRAKLAFLRSSNDCKLHFYRQSPTFRFLTNFLSLKPD